MSDYFEFKNIFLPSGVHESQIATTNAHAPTEPELPQLEQLDQLDQLEKSHISTPASTPASTPICTEDDQTGNLSDSSSPGYSDSEEEVFESIESTYQLVGIVERRTSWGDPEWWVVHIKDPEEIKKINRPGLLGISGLFKHVNLNSIPLNSKVLVEITYNSNGGCKWKENKIISLLQSKG